MKKAARGGLVIEYANPKALNPAGYNPRKISPEEFNRLRKSLHEFGFVGPVVVQAKTGRIIGGHQRVKAALAEGLAQVPTLRLEISDAKAKALNLALNKITGEWDLPLLKDLLGELDKPDFDLDVIGFTRAEVDALLHEASDGDMEKVDLWKPPELVWYLIGIPIRRFGEVQKHVAALESAAEISVQSTRDK